MKLIGLLALIILGSCSAEKQLQRALKRNPELLKADTVYHVDTVYTKEVYKDSIFKFSSDTIVMQKERLTVKVFNNYHDSTVYIEGTCKADTVTITTPQITNTIIKEPNWWINIKSYWWIVLVVIGVVLLIKGLKKIGL